MQWQKRNNYLKLGHITAKSEKLGLINFNPLCSFLGFYLTWYMSLFIQSITENGDQNVNRVLYNDMLSDSSVGMNHTNSRWRLGMVGGSWSLSVFCTQYFCKPNITINSPKCFKQYIFFLSVCPLYSLFYNYNGNKIHQAVFLYLD